MKINSQRDFTAGLLFSAFGVAFAWGATTYNVGSGARMGPGYFPLIVGILIAVMGVLITARSFITHSEDGDPIGAIAWRPLGFIIGANLVFGVLLGGLVDGRGGAIVGAGIGATVGVGATLHDAGDSYTSWAMEAAVGTAARRIPDKDSLHTVAVTSRGNPRSKGEAFAGLEDALCRAILESIRVW